MTLYFIGFPSWLYASETLEAKTKKLIEKHGIASVISVILREREAQITVEINGQLRNAQNMYRVKALTPTSIHLVEVGDELRTKQGVPVHNIVTPRSVLFDIEQAGLTVESFAALVQAGEMKAERSQRVRKVEVVERSAEAIEAEKKRYAAEEERRAAEEERRIAREKEQRQWERQRAIEEFRAQQQWELQQAIEQEKERRHREQLKAQREIRDAIDRIPATEVDIHIQ